MPRQRAREAPHGSTSAPSRHRSPEVPRKTKRRKVKEEQVDSSSAAARVASKIELQPDTGHAQPDTARALSDTVRALTDAACATSDAARASPDIIDLVEAGDGDLEAPPSLGARRRSSAVVLSDASDSSGDEAAARSTVKEEVSRGDLEAPPFLGSRRRRRAVVLSDASDSSGDEAAVGSGCAARSTVQQEAQPAARRRSFGVASIPGTPGKVYAATSFTFSNALFVADRGTCC